MIASGGFVRAVEREAARMEELKLMLALRVGEMLGVGGGGVLRGRDGGDGEEEEGRREEVGASPVAALVVGLPSRPIPSPPTPLTTPTILSRSLSPLPSITSPLNALFPHS